MQLAKLLAVCSWLQLAYTANINIFNQTFLNDLYIKVVPKIFNTNDLQRLAPALSHSISLECLGTIISPEFRAIVPFYADALGKPGSGIFEGNINWFGAYEECGRIKASHYCVTNIQIIIPNVKQDVLPLVGVCAPSSCSADDLITIFNTTFVAYNVSKMIFIPKNKGLAATYGKNAICEKKEEYSSGAITMIAISGIILFLCLIGTVTEMLKDILLTVKIPVRKSRNFMPVSYVRKGEELSSETEQEEDAELVKLVTPREKTPLLVGILLSFSLIKNTKFVMNADVPQGAITCLNGIRVLSMWWVMLGHLESMGIRMLDNVVPAFQTSQRFTFLPIINGTLSVDSFFVLSGLLVSYLSMRRFDKYGRLPLLQFYVHRFLRLTPVYVFVILFFIYIYPLLGNGPMWWLLTKDKSFDACKDYWWTNLLYINNFYPVDMGKMCIGWTWYLANDMQFYIISPIFLYALYKFKSIGGCLTMGSTLVVSFITSGVLFAHYNLTDFFAKNDQGEVNRMMNYVYTKPYCRISPYLVGVFFGYIMHQNMKLWGKWKWVKVMTLWALAISFGLMLTYGTWPYYRAENKINPSDFVNVAYGTFARFVWGIAVAWVAYACHFQFGGLINQFLSWKAFTPLSRMTYSTYMIHILVIQLFFFGRQKPFHFSDFHVGIYFMASVVASYAAAFILTVCVEMPVANIEKLVFKF